MNAHKNGLVWIVGPLVHPAHNAWLHTLASTSVFVLGPLMHVNPADVGLTPQQLEFQTVAQEFSQVELAPHAALWDSKKIFPEEALRKAAALGFAGLFVREESGGAGLGRLDGSVGAGTRVVPRMRVMIGGSGSGWVDARRSWGWCRALAAEGHWLWHQLVHRACSAPRALLSLLASDRR